MQPLRLVFDLETSDPDDVLTLCLVATHPLVDLRAVTVFPGGKDQVGVVKHVLSRLGRSNIPVGAGNPRKDVPHVSEFHYRWLGKIDPAEPDGSATSVILTALRAGATELLTGAPLTNVHRAVIASGSEPFFNEWTCQGGFAGDNVVAPEHRLPKFAGRTTCPSFNLNGDVKAALDLIQSRRLGLRRFVTKNVCHGVIYDQAMHARLPRGAHAGLDLLLEGMEVYFRKHPEGKALHDVIAAALAIRPSAATWVAGTLYRDKGEWGTRPWESWDMDGPVPDYITTALDMQRFEETLGGLGDGRERKTLVKIFQVTYRNGVPLVAYLNLPAVGERRGRPEKVGDGFIVDRDIEGRPFGVEITDPRVTLEQMNSLLLQLGQEPLSEKEWSPMLLRH